MRIRSDELVWGSTLNIAIWSPLAQVLPDVVLSDADPTFCPPDGRPGSADQQKSLILNHEYHLLLGHGACGFYRRSDLLRCFSSPPALTNTQLSPDVDPSTACPLLSGTDGHISVQLSESPVVALLPDILRFTSLSGVQLMTELIVAIRAAEVPVRVSIKLPPLPTGDMYSHTLGTLRTIWAHFCAHDVRGRRFDKDFTRHGEEYATLIVRRFMRHEDCTPAESSLLEIVATWLCSPSIRDVPMMSLPPCLVKRILRWISPYANWVQRAGNRRLADLQCAEYVLPLIHDWDSSTTSHILHAYGTFSLLSMVGLFSHTTNALLQVADQAVARLVSPISTDGASQLAIPLVPSSVTSSTSDKVCPELPTTVSRSHGPCTLLVSSHSLSCALGTADHPTPTRQIVLRKLTRKGMLQFRCPFTEEDAQTVLADGYCGYHVMFTHWKRCYSSRGSTFFGDFFDSQRGFATMADQFIFTDQSLLDKLTAAEIRRMEQAALCAKRGEQTLSRESWATTSMVSIIVMHFGPAEIWEQPPRAPAGIIQLSRTPRSGSSPAISEILSLLTKEVPQYAYADMHFFIYCCPLKACHLDACLQSLLPPTSSSLRPAGPSVSEPPDGLRSSSAPPESRTKKTRKPGLPKSVVPGVMMPLRRSSRHRPWQAQVKYNFDDYLAEPPPPSPSGLRDVAQEDIDLRVIHDVMGCANTFIADSLETDAGKGAFARRSLLKGARIGAYMGGEHLTVKQVLRTTYESQYAFADIRSGLARDAQDPQSCMMRYANDGFS